MTLYITIVSTVNAFERSTQRWFDSPICVYSKSNMAPPKERKNARQRTAAANLQSNLLSKDDILECLCSPAFAQQILSAVNPIIEKLMAEINSVKETVAEQTKELVLLKNKVLQQEEKIRSLEEAAPLNRVTAMGNPLC